jgi:hypothetical protein
MNQTLVENQGALIAAAAEILEQGERLLAGLPDDAYTRKLPATRQASIGAHYRHTLDHFANLLSSGVHHRLDYDARERGTLVEADRFAALSATRALRDELSRVLPDSLEHPLTVLCKTNYATEESQTASSSFGREMMYVVAHAVHHFALIGIMGSLMNLEMPPGFGVAPSTLKHHGDLAKT